MTTAQIWPLWKSHHRKTSALSSAKHSAIERRDKPDAFKKQVLWTNEAQIDQSDRDQQCLEDKGERSG